MCIVYLKPETNGVDLVRFKCAQSVLDVLKVYLKCVKCTQSVLDVLKVYLKCVKCTQSVLSVFKVC